MFQFANKSTPEGADMRKILVTGGAGFLGSHLCDQLIEKGNHVICLDNLHTGSAANIQHLTSNPRFKFIEHDVTEPIDVEIEEIYNLACPASPIHYQSDPVKTIRTNVLGAINMLDLATKYGAKVLQASTSEVYGDPEVHPQEESYWGRVNPIGIRSCYDEGKRCAETLFFDYHRQNGTRIKVARIFNTYGPRMHPQDGRVVSNFVVQNLTRSAITIYGDGSQSRSFCYVDDLISGLISLMDAQDEIRGPMNLGNPSEFTMLELASLIMEISGSSSDLIFKDLPEDDPKQRKPDIALASSVLGWEPKVETRAGLIKTIEFFRAVL
jgi:UDP-glucuronate decarboxylase